jgi:hypothetical protein
MNRKTILLSGMSLCFLVSGIFSGVIATGVPGSSPFFYIAAVITAAVGIIFGINGVRLTLRDARLRKEDQDAFQANYNRAFRAFPVSALILAVISAAQLRGLWAHPGDVLHIITAALTVTSAFAISWAYAFMLSGRSRAPRLRRMIQDEFFQDNLAKSRSDGFFALLAMVTICFFVGLFSAQLAVALLPFSAGFSVAFAGWRFNYRDSTALVPETTSER